MFGRSSAEAHYSLGQFLYLEWPAILQYYTQATSWHLLRGSLPSHPHARLMYQSGERQKLLQSYIRYLRILLAERDVVVSVLRYRSVAVIPQESATIQSGATRPSTFSPFRPKSLRFILYILPRSLFFYDLACCRWATLLILLLRLSMGAISKAVGTASFWRTYPPISAMFNPPS